MSGPLDYDGVTTEYTESTQSLLGFDSVDCVYSVVCRRRGSRGLSSRRMRSKGSNSRPGKVHMIDPTEDLPHRGLPPRLDDRANGKTAGWLAGWLPAEVVEHAAAETAEWPASCSTPARAVARTDRDLRCTGLVPAGW